MYMCMRIRTDLMEAVLGYMNFLSFDFFNIPRYLIDVHICARECVYLHVCNIYVCIRTYMYKHIYVYVHVYIYIYIHMHIYVGIYFYIFICIYTYM